jgi:hypothetical protein
MMFFRAVYDLWYFDAATRRRYQLHTISVAFLYGVFNSLALGRPEGRVTWETLGLIAVLTVGFTVFYYLRTQARKYKALYAQFCELFQQRRLFELGLACTIGLALIALAKYLPSDRVEAFSLNSQLRAAASPEPLSPSVVTSLDTVFQRASARSVRLDPHLVAVANDNLLNESRNNPAAWPAVLGVLSYRSGLDIEAATSPSANSGCFVPPSVSEAVVSIEQMSIVGCKGQGLDGLQFKDVVIKDSTILYHGGPAVLQNVQFENCKFLLDYSPGAQELARALTAARSVTVTLPGK